MIGCFASKSERSSTNEQYNNAGFLSSPRPKKYRPTTEDSLLTGADLHVLRQMVEKVLRCYFRKAGLV